MGKIKYEKRTAMYYVFLEKKGAFQQQAMSFTDLEFAKKRGIELCEKTGKVYQIFKLVGVIR